MERVKVEKAEYDAKSDTIAWEVTLKTGQKADLVWRRADFGPSLRIDAVIPVPIVEEFCQNIVGKEVNLVIEERLTVAGSKDQNMGN